MNLTVNIYEWGGSLNAAPVALNIPASGIEITDADGTLTTNGGLVNTLSATIADDTSATISVSLAGYYTYEQTIRNVYKADATIDIFL